MICTSHRFTICTKPLNVHHTVLYTIIDWVEERRGPVNLIFGLPAETTEQCLEMLVMLCDGEIEVSCNRRRGMDLDLEWIRHGKETIWPTTNVIHDEGYPCACQHGGSGDPWRRYMHDFLNPEHALA